ncbi:hypothetical protein [Falsiroseomonas oryzae]|uniref:hypothetical protein n=1 Tax=Falsiroseomonas oryzae TaxID=2766473 RepID=UPI0022EB17F1|nr:hypothetical protein [Roseomonas sp. MO-31]
MDGKIVVGILALLVLASLFFWAFYWNGRVQVTSYVGETLLDALSSVDLQRRLREIDEAWLRHSYHVRAMREKDWLSAHPYPEAQQSIKEHDAVRMSIRYLEQNGSVGTLRPGSFPSRDDKNYDEKIGRDILEYIKVLQDWRNTILEEKAKSLYESDVNLCRNLAQKNSEKLLGQIDLTILRGVGPDFILRFTAIVTIVFVVFLLNTVGNLGSDQAGTILAAIAGYVLGQGTARREPTSAPVVGTKMKQHSSGPVMPPATGSPADNSRSLQN